MARTPAQSSAASETERIRTHLIGALGVLREADTRHLASEPRARRSQAAAALQGYIETGLFPRNTDSQETRPSLIDDLGTPCALAHLAEQTGGASLIQRLASVANHEPVRMLRANGELRAWLASVGFTAEEAARIQPSYTYVPYPSPLECACRELSGPVARGTVVFVARVGGPTACDVRIDEILSVADGATRVGADFRVAATIHGRCGPVTVGTKLLITWPRAELDALSDDGPTLRVDGGALRFETCRVARGAGVHTGPKPAALSVPRSQIEAVIGKSDADCKAFFKLEPRSQSGHNPGRDPQPPPAGVIIPHPEASGGTPAPRPAAPVEPERAKPEERAESIEPSRDGSFELGPLYYVGGGGVLLVASAAVGYVLVGRRGSKG